jgi:dTDP-4-amino-4,6-dideoxygalactose transaminase
VSDLPVNVTQPSLPPLSEYIPYLERLWETKQLTNGGEYHRLLEQELCKHLGVEHISLFANGTLALIAALRALDVKGEVITTPFTFAATAHSLLWNNLVPVFVDIDPTTGNLDPKEVAKAVNSKTSAILPVHCYGNPCDVEAIEKIATDFSLKVVYDAAHAFGIELNGQSLLSMGDCSVLSFHATKVFNTFEGGAVVCADLATKQRLDELKNFGFLEHGGITNLGFNAKMNEASAALGLLQLNYVAIEIEKRLQWKQLYRCFLEDIPGIRLIEPQETYADNGAYCPIEVGPSCPLTRDQLCEKLKAAGINARKYFHPLVSNTSLYKGGAWGLPEAERLADNVLCLPLYADMNQALVERIVAVIRGG